MQRTLLILMSCGALGASASGTYALLTRPAPAVGPASAAAPVAPPIDLEPLRRALEQLTERVASLERAPHGATRIDPGAVEALARAAVADALAAHAGEAGPAPEPRAPRPKETADLVAELLAADDVAQAELWRQLAADGRADEVLAALRERAEAAPQDAERQLELGQAYIARIAEVGNSPLAGSYAMQADAAFDRALAADPEHHAARFHKAVALSFWPPVLGKQAQAIQQFELLIGQQARSTPQPHFAETHLLLGNMYQQTGQREKALAAWAHGAELFPEHPGLTRQLELARQQQ